MLQSVTVFSGMTRTLSMLGVLRPNSRVPFHSVKNIKQLEIIYLITNVSIAVIADNIASVFSNAYVFVCLFAYMFVRL